MTTQEKQALAIAKNEQFMSLPPKQAAESALEWAVSTFGKKAALSSSLSLEDQVITAMISAGKDSCRIFTLDTGRQFQETYDLIDLTEMTYGIRIEVYFPDYARVQQMVRDRGINLFYDSIESRHLCCAVRKIEPLKRALEGTEVWITGIRREQSVTRKDMQMCLYDASDDVIKLNPLLLWSEQEVRAEIAAKAIPYNKLHDKGFPSIGCRPCTRAVLPGEDIRAGRWWWEDPVHKECGLHSRG